MLSARVERSTPCGLLASAAPLQWSSDGSATAHFVDDLLWHCRRANGGRYSCRSVSPGPFQLHRDRIRLFIADGVSLVTWPSTASLPADEPFRSFCLPRLVGRACLHARWSRLSTVVDGRLHRAARFRSPRIR